MPDPIERRTREAAPTAQPATHDAAPIRHDLPMALAALLAERDALSDELHRLRELRDRDHAAVQSLAADLETERAAARSVAAAMSMLRDRMDALAPRYQDLLRHHLETLQGRAALSRRENGADHHILPMVRFNLEQPADAPLASGEIEIRGWSTRSK